MIIPSPLRLRQQSQPFDSHDWIYEIKHDGFRAMAVLEKGQCRLLSRTHHELTGFRDLRIELANEVRVEEAILDGELAIMDETGRDETGRTLFAPMMKRRQGVRYFAFDLVWLNGRDLRNESLLNRKARLKRLIPRYSPHILYVDHVQHVGRRLYEIACQLDLEGIVAKRIDSAYVARPRAPWIKIKNPSYSQKAGRRDLLKRSAS